MSVGSIPASSEGESWKVELNDFLRLEFILFLVFSLFFNRGYSKIDGVVGLTDCKALCGKIVILVYIVIPNIRLYSCTNSFYNSMFTSPVLGRGRGFNESITHFVEKETDALLQCSHSSSRNTRSSH